MKPLHLLSALLTATILAAPGASSAQWPPESLTNLQVLPKDTPVRELTMTMRDFAFALGVQCTHCHVGEDSNDLSSIDFRSDDKLAKRQAREMIRMVRRLNEEALPALPERSDPPVVVACRTCHRGLERPVDIRDLLAETFEREGVEVAIARYRELREEYYGSDAYDFRHFVLANVAERVADRDPDGAIRLLELNGELFPTSGQTFATMAKIYRDKGDVDSAIRALERAVAADPSAEEANAFYRGIIERLREPR